jgi:hypothetical protein
MIFGRRGSAWHEADVKETVILDLLEGQYQYPVRVVGFNSAENGHKTSRNLVAVRGR